MDAANLEALQLEAQGVDAAIDRGLAGARWAKRYSEAREEELDALDQTLTPPYEDDCYVARCHAPRAYAAAWSGHDHSQAVQSRASAAHGALLAHLDAREGRVATREVDVCATALTQGLLRRPSVAALELAEPHVKARYLAASESYGYAYRRSRMSLVRALVAIEARRLELRLVEQLDVRAAGLEARIAREAERSILGEVDKRLGLVDWRDVTATKEVQHPSESALAVQAMVAHLLRRVPAGPVPGKLTWEVDTVSVPLVLETCVVAARLDDSAHWREAVHISAHVGAEPGEVRFDVLIDVQSATERQR